MLYKSIVTFSKFKPCFPQAEVILSYVGRMNLMKKYSRYFPNTYIMPCGWIPSELLLQIKNDVDGSVLFLSDSFGEHMIPCDYILVS